MTKEIPTGNLLSPKIPNVCDDAMGFADLNARSCRFRRGTRDYAAGRTLAADQHAGRIPVQIEGKSAVRAMVTIANTDACVAMHAPPNPRPGQVVR